MKLPEGAKLSVEGTKITLSGPKGTLSRDFGQTEVKVELRGGEVSVSGPAMLANTVSAHIANMATGVTFGYSKKLKALFSHFPISVEVKGREMLIKNFMGEKQPRKARVMGSTKVEVKGHEISVSGLSKEDVGQTIANLKAATKVRNRDSRVFQDGFYIVE
jgi:large subunit ribosomal protein L6